MPSIVTYFIPIAAYQRRRLCRQSQKEVEEMRRKANEERREVARFLCQVRSDIHLKCVQRPK